MSVKTVKIGNFRVNLKPAVFVANPRTILIPEKRLLGEKQDDERSY